MQISHPSKFFLLASHTAGGLDDFMVAKGKMLFSFRSSDAAKYPRLLYVQTIAMAFDEKGIARLLKQDLANYDEAENAVVFTEFEKPRVHLIGAASEWPDVIGSEVFTRNPIIVSQRVIAAFQKHDVTGYTARPVEVVKKSSRKLQVRDAPQYHLLEISARIAIPVPSIVRTEETVPDAAEKLLGAWDGADLFIDRGSESNCWAIFCSEKVFELARDKKWTNCGFQPLHYFAPHHKCYLKHESPLPLAELIQQYTGRLK